MPGRSPVLVPKACFTPATWPRPERQQGAFATIRRVLEFDVNFLDTGPPPCGGGVTTGPVWRSGRRRRPARLGQWRRTTPAGSPPAPGPAPAHPRRPGHSRHHGSAARSPPARRPRLHTGAGRHPLLVDLVIQDGEVDVERLGDRATNHRLDLVGQRGIGRVAAGVGVGGIDGDLALQPATLPRASVIAPEGTATRATWASAASPPSRPIRVMVCPARSQRRASPPPTLPRPMTAMFMLCSNHYY
jgi:hypothetical protein